MKAALEPLVQLLLDLGVTVTEAEDALRDVYVRVAHDQICRESTKASLSRIALKCGLYRSEVSGRLRQRDVGAQSAAELDQHRLNRLLSAWHSDPDFVTKEGVPRVLPLRGQGSFEVLVSRYAANHYLAVVRQELERVGAIRLLSRQRLEVLAREYNAQRLDGRRLKELGARARDVLRSLVDEARTARSDHVLLSAMGFGIAPEYLPLLRKTLLNRGSTFMRLIEEELNDPSRRTGEHGRRVGLYLIGVEDEATTAPPQDADREVVDRTPRKHRHAKRRPRS